MSCLRGMEDHVMTDLANARRTAEDQRAVLIACPFNEGLVPTGMEVADLSDLPLRNVLIDCLDCGQDHPWTPNEAVLAQVWEGGGI